MPLQHRLGGGIGLLPIDAPVFQLFERDRCPGHRTTHIRARSDHAKIAIEILDLGLAGHRRRTFKAIEHFWPPPRSLVGVQSEPPGREKSTECDIYINTAGRPGERFFAGAQPWVLRWRYADALTKQASLPSVAARAASRLGGSVRGTWR